MMDNTAVGGLIRRMRCEKGMTQKQLADMLYISDRTVSKWECGSGCPELSLIPEIAEIFGITIESLIGGADLTNQVTGGNMKKLLFYVCPVCGNIITAAAEASVSCCGRVLSALTPVKDEGEMIKAERIDNDYFITGTHQMKKEHYITFVAFLTCDGIILRRQYPEWDIQTRIPFSGHGTLVWHCSRDGLFYRYI